MHIATRLDDTQDYESKGRSLRPALMYGDLGSLFSRSRFGRCPGDHLSLIEYRIRSQVCWRCGQHLLFAIDQAGGVEGSHFKTMPVRDCVRGASLNTVAAKDAAVIVDVVNLGIAFRAADPVLRGVLRRFDINAIGWAGSGAQKACNTLL